MLRRFMKITPYRLLFTKSYVQCMSISKTLTCTRGVYPVRCYGIRPSLLPHIEENTLGFRILEHLRTNNKYATTLTKDKSQQLVQDEQATKQLLLIIAHNPEVKTSDVLKLFSLYVSTSSIITQDIISNRTLMSDVKKKTIKSISNMTENELKDFAYMLKDLGFDKSGYLQSLVKGVREECLRRAQECSLFQGLELFDILLICHGNKIYRKKEFDAFLTLFETNIESASPQHLVQILHYIGLAKKKKLSKEFVYNIIEKLDKHILTLTFEDIGIAVAGIFKSNVKLEKTSPFVEKIAECLKARLAKTTHLTDLESYGLVAMIKLLRAAKFHNESLLSALKRFVSNCDENILSAQTVPHILAMFSNCNDYEPDVFCKLERKILKFIKADSYDLRMRDLVRVLWCFSHVNHKCSTETLEIFEKCLMEFVHNGDVAKSPHFLSDALLSMAILQHYPVELMKEAFKPELLQGLQDHQKSKQLSRLFILHECLKVELPTILIEPPVVDNADVPKRTLADEMYYRPTFKRLSDGVKWINSVVGRTVLKLQFPIPYINYASITVDFSQVNFQDAENLADYDKQQKCIIDQLSSQGSLGKSQLSIEVLDSQSLIQQTSHPVGILRLKLRLLRRLQWDIRCINSAEVDSCGNDDNALGALLLEKITMGQ